MPPRLKPVANKGPIRVFQLENRELYKTEVYIFCQGLELKNKRFSGNLSLWIILLNFCFKKMVSYLRL